MNICLKQFGLDMLKSYYSDLSKYRLRTVSVASGIGVIEHAIQNPLRPIICIDPDPHSFQRIESNEPLLTIMIPPHYPTCADLISAQPDIVGNCNIMLNWPEGNEKGRYDVESIALLQPLRILLVIETTGSGGSDLFYEFLKCKVHGFEPVERDFSWVNEYHETFDWTSVQQYYVIRSNVIRYETGGSYCSRNYRLLLLSSTKPRTPPMQVCEVRNRLVGSLFF